MAGIHRGKLMQRRGVRWSAVRNMAGNTAEHPVLGQYFNKNDALLKFLLKTLHN